MGTKHTPGPWTANQDGNIQCEKLNDYGNWIVAGIQRELTDEDRANAALIAAAPDLLEACKLMLEHFAPGAVACAEWALSGNSQTDAILRATRAAIAKAEAAQ